MKQPIKRRSWTEFRDSKMLWFVNRILHVFGWAIVIEVDAESGVVESAYPARVAFRGFSEEAETEGFVGVSQYMVNNADALLREAKDDKSDETPASEAEKNWLFRSLEDAAARVAEMPEWAKEFYRDREAYRRRMRGEEPG